MCSLKCTNLKELWIGDHYSGTANYLLESLEQLPNLGKLWICDDWETPEHAGVAAWSRESRQKIVRHCRERGIELLLNLDWDDDIAEMDDSDGSLMMSPHTGYYGAHHSPIEITSA